MKEDLPVHSELHIRHFLLLKSINHMTGNMTSNTQSLVVDKVKRTGTYTKMMLQQYTRDRMTEQFHLDQVNRRRLGNLSPLSKHKCVLAAAFS